MLLYSVFHLNLAFSSIEEEQRPEVIHRCYWPLLRLIEKQRIPIGIEASGYTLECIATLDPSWLAALRELCAEGLVEFVGSGYSQLIGPLVPAEVNQANQRIGQETYERLLGFRPRLVLIAEQAFTAGLIPIYRDAGYQAIVMEWDNPASTHPDWDSDWRFFPQRACGPEGESLPVIWNMSIPFQKFQRYAHGELELPAYLEYLSSKIGETVRTFALYGNDAEIFDFRPGRFQNEAAMRSESEWERIGCLYQALQQDDRFKLVKPVEVLDHLEGPKAGNRLHLESPAQPVPVKKQPKYNVLRWAVSGRDNLEINTACWRIFSAIKESPGCDPELWKELCYLWSSDFRTHITENRWQSYRWRLVACLERVGQSTSKSSAGPICIDTGACAPFRITREADSLWVETPTLQCRLNCRRGLAILALGSKVKGSIPLVGTLEHGYFDDIHYGADYYTGHLVLEIPGQHKITDLEPVEPQVGMRDGSLVVRGTVETRLGPLVKEVIFDPLASSCELSYTLEWDSCPNGSLRFGHITLNPERFDAGSLRYETHNGGFVSEKFFLGGKVVDHLAPVSPLVSANQGLGVTGGWAAIGDRLRQVEVDVAKTEAAVTGHILYVPVGERYLYRLIFSAQELDDTACYVESRGVFSGRCLKLKIRLPEN